MEPFALALARADGVLPAAFVVPGSNDASSATVDGDVLPRDENVPVLAAADITPLSRTTTMAPASGPRWCMAVGLLAHCRPSAGRAFCTTNREDPPPT